MIEYTRVDTCPACGCEMHCDYCDGEAKYVNVIGARYYVDESLIEQFAEALIEGKREEMDKLLVEVGHRMDGKCFCDARSESECTCGAW
jgi:DNA repair photolyase